MDDTQTVEQQLRSTMEELRKGGEDGKAALIERALDLAAREAERPAPSMTRLSDVMRLHLPPALKKEVCSNCRGKGRLKEQSLGMPSIVLGVEHCSCAIGEEIRGRDERLRRSWEQEHPKALVRLAGIPPKFQDYTVTAFPGDQNAKKMVRRWLRESQGNLILWGPNGTGKTGLATAALRERLESTRGRFVDCQELLHGMRMRRNDGAWLSETVAELRAAPLLLLDDLRSSERRGDESWVVDFALEKLALLIGGRYNDGRLLIVTTNCDSHALASDMAPGVGPRLASRITEGALIVEVRGPSLRKAAPQPEV